MIAKTTKKRVTLEGTAPIMFDRYVSNEAKLAPERKLYLTQNNELYLPALNIMSFLTATNTESAPKLLRDSRKYKDLSSALLASISISPSDILFERKGKPIKFGGGFNNDDRDPVSGVEIVHSVARLPKGIPNPKERPMLPLPWTLEFDFTVYPHPNLDLDDIYDLIKVGGERIGLGTFRKQFGKFEMSWTD